MDLLDNLWLLFASALVLTMQAGFLLVEGGRVRAKNSINVAQKNITDLVVTWVCFMGVGFYLMYGVPMPYVASVPSPGSLPPVNPLHFLYQLGFCGTAVTVLSGAVAERMSFKAYLGLVCVIAALIYPLVGRLVWGGAFAPVDFAWLRELGFVDFAGATVVHGVGGWAGLVLVLMIGPRIGRFDEAGRPRAMASYNAVIALQGVLVLLIGWIGFNGGALSLSDPLLPSVVVNTLTAAVHGGLAGMLLACYLQKGVFNPSGICNGLIGGLVACTAGVHLMSHGDAVVVGALGGLTAVGGAHVLLHRFRLDDPVDVIACHGLAGTVGALGVAFVAPAAALPAGSRLVQLGVQAFGVVAIFALVCTLTWLAARAIGRVCPLRVPEAHERLGLNHTEHGESIGTGRLQLALNEKLEDATLFDSRVELSEDDEHAELASTLNDLIGRHETALDVIREGENRFRQLAETSSDWLWETDENLIVSYMSPSDSASGSALGENCAGRHLFDLLQVEKGVRRHITERIRQGLPTDVFDALIKSTSDRSVPVFAEVRGVPNHDASGAFTGYRGTIMDITVRKAAENRAVFLARHDELTGLRNRRALKNDLATVLENADRLQQSVVVAGIDLDGFKAVNDLYGHATGDELLKLIAGSIEDALRPGDRIFRTGGDEFVMVMDGFEPDTALERGRRIAERMIDHVGGEYEIGGVNVRVGASAGIALYPEHAADDAEALRMADLALYAAKSAGKGRALVFEPPMDTDMQYRMRMEKDLRAALDNGEFHLAYQPLVDAGSEALVGFEALIRWAHPERGEVPPGAFIGMAEQLDMMDEIGTFVLREACAFAADWAPDASGRTPRVSVNVSPQQFRNAAFLAVVSEALADAGLPPERLELEITEDVLVHDFESVIGLLQALREMGVAVAIDDFGSGQTSLRYLNRFPVTTLKIDRSFVRHLGSDVKADEITESIVRLGRRLGVQVLAEGVEEKAQLSMLRGWDCDQVQGFLFAKPMSGDSVTELLAARRSEGGADREAG